MKNFRRMCVIVMLSCIFSVSASAGDIHAGRTSPAEATTATTSDPCGEIAFELQQVVIDIILSLV
jgi:hypothetical protein